MIGHPTISAARDDPNAFIEWILDIDQAVVHEEIQDHYTNVDDGLVEAHRGIGKTVQSILRLTWEIGHDPTYRWRYIQATQDESKQSVEFAKRVIEEKRYQLVFPWIRPDATLWGKTAFRIFDDRQHHRGSQGQDVRRATMRRDPVLTADGIFGHAGGRVDGVVFDDICDLETSVRQPVKREQVKDFYRSVWLPSIAADSPRRRIWRIGTPWHVSDLMADWRKECGARDVLLSRGVVDNKSPWPEAFPLGSEEEPGSLLWWRKNLGPIAYGRAFELNPISAELLVFDRAWLDESLYIEIDHTMVRAAPMASFDFAFTEKRAGAKTSRSPDYSVCLIGVRTYLGHLFILDMVRQQSTFPDFARAALAACKRHGVVRAVAEDNQAQVELVRALNNMADFPVIGHTRSTDKITRAADAQAFVESGRFHILAERQKGSLNPVPTLQPLYDEMITFPAAEHDDTVDTAIDLIQLADRLAQTPAKDDVKPVEAARGASREILAIPSRGQAGRRTPARRLFG